MVNSEVIKMLKKDFREIVERFLEKTGIAPTNLGCWALKDPMFVSNIRKGREFREKTRSRVLNFMQQYVADNGLEFDFNGWRE